MSSTPMNVQEIYLNKLRRSETQARVHLIDGTQRIGRLVVFDSAVIILQVNGTEVTFFKNNLIMIEPMDPDFRVFGEENRLEPFKPYATGSDKNPAQGEGGLPLGESMVFRIPRLKRSYEPYYPS
jgi:RNA chaperone Hfq